MSLEISSDAFEPGGEIPERYTCDGADRSPPLSWSELPARTKSLALIVDDPDAPDPAAPTKTWVHWVLINLPPTISELPEAATPLPSGAQSGLNDWQRVGYGGPGPPIGRHRYCFKLYALDTRLALRGRPTKDDVEQAMRGHVLTEAVLIATYQRR